MNHPTEEEVQKRFEEIRRKRTETLVGAWELMQRKYKELKETAYLHPHLVAQVVENYLEDRLALVNRDNIRGRIQRHKIAGLMAACILKSRPIQLRDDTGRSARVSKDNEVFAVLHGLAICSEGQTDKMQEFFQLRMSGAWIGDFIYHLRRHPDCGLWCAMVFETESVTYFPSNLDTSGE